MSRARALIEGTVTVLGTLGFAAAAIGLWIVLDPAPDQRASRLAAARAPQIIHAVRRCPAPDAAPGPSRDAIASLLAQLEETRP